MTEIKIGTPATATHWLRGVKVPIRLGPLTIRLYWPLSDPKPGRSR